VRWPPAWELFSLSNELIVGQLPAGKNVGNKAEDIIWISHQATTGEDSRMRRRITFSNEVLSDRALVTCSYDL
jgi:hypothetical protein